MKHNVVIYARFSSHSQTEQSIEGQLRECYAYAEKNDLVVIGEYIDRALTGTTDKRPQFLKMIDDSNKKNFEYVLVYQLDRFARNRYDSAIYKAKLKKNGVRVISAKENISQDASGIVLEAVLEGFAEYYSAELSQKVRRGIKESLIKGFFIGGYGLLGYDIVDKKWTINPTEADIVRDIFNRYKNGEKAKDIIDRLNNKGIKTKAGSKFNMNSLARIIRNTKYIGIVESHENIYTDIVPAIVDEEVFYACNAIMDEHKHKQRVTKNEKPYILSGKLYCGYCNSLMTAESGTSKTGKIYHYYKCFGKKRNNDSCGKKNYRQQELEDLVFSTTIDYILKPKVIDQIAEIVVKKFNSEIGKSNELKLLENDLKTAEKALKGILSAIEQGVVTKTTKDRLLTLEAQKDSLTDKIAVEKAREIKTLEFNTVRAFLNYFARKKYESGQEKNEFFNSFINRVVLFDDYIYIFYNTDGDNPTKLKTSEHKELLEDLKSSENKKKNSFNSKEFKRVSLGGEEGIRTLVGLLPNGFQDRLVMTTSIPLRNMMHAVASYYGASVRRGSPQANTTSHTPPADRQACLSGVGREYLRRKAK